MTATTAPNSFGFFFANPTTLFVADATDGLQEWTLSSGNWSEVATLGTPSSDVGVAGVQNGSTVSLYFTTGTTSGWSADNKLEADTFTFTSGTSGPGTFSLPTTLATASGDSGFSGVALLPAVPEPFSSSLLLLGGLGMMLRRGSRRK